jgi:diphthine synthase
MLYIIGLGLGDCKDITLKGLQAVKGSDYVYLEYYTSKLACSIKQLEDFYGKKIILADRKLVENDFEKEILSKASTKEVAFLVIGDPLSATTHIDLISRANEKKVEVEIINNASILTVVGITGLELYKFGKITSIPFNNENITAPVDALKQNQSIGLHTLFLLDLDPINNKFMRISEAAGYLLKKGVNPKLTAIGCAALGTENKQIKAATLSGLQSVELKHFPQCLIIPGKLHFVEEDFIKRFY